MNRNWKAYGLGLLAGIGLATYASAQVPAAPAVPAAAPTKNIWTMLLPSAEQRAGCKERLCNSSVGELVKNGMKPVATMTGGLIGGKCVGPTPGEMAKDMAKPADSSEGAAARIKKSEAEAQARREAVRYLGTVDCRYWPDAEPALISALRSDPNECVRHEAALALTRGCCCNRKTMEALAITVTGSKKDGFPAECSERVKAAAAEALARCSSVYVEAEKAPNGGERPKAAPGLSESVRKALDQAKLNNKAPSCKDGLFGIVAQSVNPSASHASSPQGGAAVTTPLTAERGLLFLLAGNQPVARERVSPPRGMAPRGPMVEVMPTTTVSVQSEVPLTMPVGAVGISHVPAPAGTADDMTIEVIAPDKP